MINVHVWTVERQVLKVSDPREAVEQYLDYMLEANKSINVTRITDRESAELLHIEDSLVPINDIIGAPAGLYGDLGTGGGFPGVPVAIYSKRKAVLIDSVKKKVSLVEKGISLIGFEDQISIYGGRIEELALKQPASFAVLTARAVTKLVSLVELASPLLIPQGILVCYKAQTEQSEIDDANRVCHLLGMELVKDYTVTLSDNETTRRIFIFKKIAKSQIRLPRKIGAAQHNPL